VTALLAGAAEANEMLWELPLIGEYRRDLDSRVADLKNIGDGPAGTITAALFLREFVGDVPWAHVDFSRTVMSDGFACPPKGGRPRPPPQGGGVGVAPRPSGGGGAAGACAPCAAPSRAWRARVARAPKTALVG